VEAISLPDNYVLLADPSAKKPVAYAQARWLKDAVAFNQDIDPKQYRLAKSIVGTLSESSSVAIETPRPREADGSFVLKGREPISVKVPEMSEAQKANQFYEVSYYLDQYYVGESAVTGATVVYELDAKTLSAGSHVLVVNAVLGMGRVGTQSLKVTVP
jgi:hypothetical protein